MIIYYGYAPLFLLLELKEPETANLVFIISFLVMIYTAALLIPILFLYSRKWKETYFLLERTAYFYTIFEITAEMLGFSILFTAYSMAIMDSSLINYSGFLFSFALMILGGAFHDFGAAIQNKNCKKSVMQCFL